MRFFDTNILVYAATNQDDRKRRIAIDLITHALEVNHDGVISIQVLTEFANTLLAKKLATADEIETWISLFYPLLATEVTMDVVRNAIRLKEQYRIQFYDAQIVATAAKLGCHEIVSEDLSDTQLYEGIAVVNPFKRAKQH